MTDQEIVKICNKHGDLTENDIIKRGKYRSGNQAFRCKKCMSELHKKNYDSNKETIYKKTRIYKLNNKDKVKKWRKNEYDKVKNDIEKKCKKREQDRKSYLKSKEKLKDSYIKELLTARTNIKYNQIPQCFVNLKRSLILLKRGLKAAKNEN